MTDSKLPAKQTAQHPAYQGDNPFRSQHLPAHANVGTVAAETERAIAEVQASMIIAKRFPRDEARAFERVMMACSRPGLAAQATYSFPRGGQKISGPSIRLAEELARCYGNIEYGIRELSRKDGVSEMQAFAWDKESNVSSVQNFTVRHIRDKQGGGVALTEERDIYEVTANMGGRRLRARLLAILPPDLVEAALEQCRRTLAGNSDIPVQDRVRRVVAAFTKYGVTSEHLSGYLGKSLDDVLPEDIADLQEVFNSIKDGIAKPSDYFGGERQPANDNHPAAAGLNAAAAAKADDKPEGDKGAEGGAARKPPAKRPAEKKAKPAPEPETQDEEPPAPEAGDPGAGSDGGDLF